MKTELNGIKIGIVCAFVNAVTNLRGMWKKGIWLTQRVAYQLFKKDCFTIELLDNTPEVTTFDPWGTILS
jgi:hypothetical protein